MSTFTKEVLSRTPVLEPVPVTKEMIPEFYIDPAVLRIVDGVVWQRDRPLHEHLWHVGYYAYILCAMSGLRRWEIRQTVNGALLHDIGKLASPLITSIANTPGKIDQDERLIMKYHTILGDELVRSEGWEGYAPYVRSHHEAYDPKLFGYPDGIAGEALPLGPQRVSIVDWYAATRAKRPDMPSFSQKRATEEVLYQFTLGRWNPKLRDEFEAFVLYRELIKDRTIFF